MSGLISSVQNYSQNGVPPEHQVFAMPWFGFDYRCHNKSTLPSLCKLQQYQSACQQGCVSSSSIEVDYGQILQILQQPRYHCPFGVQYEHDSASAVLRYVDMLDGSHHELWFDNAASLAVKYAALRDLGVRGISSWNTASVNYTGSDGDAAVMWDTLAVFNGPKKLDTLPTSSSDAENHASGAADGMPACPPKCPPCPCNNTELCKPITKVYRKEVFAFHWEMKTKPGLWRNYNWSMITTIAVFGNLDPDLLCHAHAHGARVSILNNGNE
jgi:hypothetical protein